MPFKSKNQKSWMFANKPEMAKEWASETKSIKSLPEKVSGKKSGRKKVKRTRKKRN